MEQGLLRMIDDCRSPIDDELVAVVVASRQTAKRRGEIRFGFQSSIDQSAIVNSSDSGEDP
jgi:hypothetical protein